MKKKIEAKEGWNEKIEKG